MGAAYFVTYITLLPLMLFMHHAVRMDILLYYASSSHGITRLRIPVIP